LVVCSGYLLEKRSSQAWWNFPLRFSLTSFIGFLFCDWVFSQEGSLTLFFGFLVLVTLDSSYSIMS